MTAVGRDKFRLSRLADGSQHLLKHQPCSTTMLKEY
jgi:hypothetical protein